LARGPADEQCESIARERLACRHFQKSRDVGAGDVEARRLFSDRIQFLRRDPWRDTGDDVVVVRPINRIQSFVVVSPASPCMALVVVVTDTESWLPVAGRRDVKAQALAGTCDLPMTTPTATPSLKLRRIDWGDGGRPREDYEVIDAYGEKVGRMYRTEAVGGGYAWRWSVYGIAVTIPIPRGP
jgi:hypothetical protein